MSDSLGAYGIVHGILQGRILEWVAVLFPEDLPNPGIKHSSPTVQLSHQGMFIQLRKLCPQIL